jgi:hypothetical protein
MPTDTAEDCRKSRISIEHEVTTALAGIGTITTDRDTVTQEHFWYLPELRACAAIAVTPAVRPGQAEG